MASDQATRIGDQLRAWTAAARNGVAIEMAKELRDACPKDTHHASHNFIPSVDAPFEGEATGDAQQRVGIVAVAAAPITQAVYVTNNVPYLPRLIAGSSQQAPAGWDVAAIDRAQATVQARYDALTIEVGGDGTNPTAEIKVEP